MTMLEDAITFELTTTIDDVVAAHRHLTRRPAAAIRRSRFRQIAWYLLLFFVPLFAVVLGSNDPAAALQIFSEASLWLHLVSDMLVVGILAASLGLLWRLLSRASIRATFAATRRHRPDVAADDPRLPLTRTYRFDESGFVTTTSDDEIWESWLRVKGLDETATLLIVKVGVASGYPLPKAQLTSELQERLHRYIVARATSKWPF